MIILDATTKSLEVVLGGTVSTTQLPVVSTYVDVTTTTFTGAEQDAASNNTTAVTIVSAPAAATQRQIKYISIYNVDTASATVTIRYNNNGTTRIISKTTLGVNEALYYTDGEGWSVIDASGQFKQSYNSAASTTTVGITKGQALALTLGFASPV